MKKTTMILAGIILLATATAAAAACRTYTMMVNGELVTCTECCTNGFCHVDCF